MSRPERPAPDHGSRPDAPAPGDRSRPPAPGPIRPFELPPATSDALNNGLALRFLRRERLPLATLTLVLDAGERLVGEAEAGLAVFTGEALEGGTEDRGADELAKALEGLGADLSIHTGWDATTVSLTVLPDRFEEAAGLLAEVVRRPAFPSSELHRIREQRLAAIVQRRMSPDRLASDQAARYFFAQGVPFARPVAGTEASVEGLGPDGARSFVQQAYGPEGGGVAVVGDVDEERARALVEQRFGDWEPADRRPGTVEVRPRFRDRRIVVVSRPGSVQSELRIGHVGVARRDPAYFPLTVFNTVLGGAFTSRLNLSLREKHGFTYGVRSRFAFRREPGPFWISTAVGTEQTAPAVEEAVRQVEDLVREGPREDEVAAARDYLSGVFPLRFETTAQVASRLAELVVYDLPEDFHATYRHRIGEVTRDDAHEAGARAVRPDELVAVVVGDADAVQAPLEALGLGPVEVREAEGTGPT